ncbi:MAG: DUF4214 domain-containing protein [Reyranellaceae bacterium]
MTTTMTFALSPALTTQLAAQPNSYVFALQYAGGQFVAGSSTAALVANGQPGNMTITLPTSFSSGQVFILVQQNGDGTLGQTISTLNGGDVNAISPTTAQQYGYQYQLVEATLSSSTGDLGDISSVNTFAFPVTYADSNGARGFAPGVVGNTLQSTLNTIAPGSLQSGLSIGPAQGPNMATNPWPAADWTAYLTALSNGSTNATKTLQDMTIVTYFGPSDTVSQYSVSYNSSTQYFTLTPNTTNGATNTDYIRITYANLLNSIYAQNGAIEISTDGGNTWSPSTTTTPNTADGTVMKFLVAGFDAGYWGGSGTSVNPNDPSIFDLNDTWNWNYNYAYDATFNPAGSAIVYSNILGSGPGTAGGNNRFYDPWAQAVQNASNTYGWSYGDLISQGGTNPQISLWNASANQQVSNIAVTLYSNTETITSSAGFIGVPPAYVAPPAVNQGYAAGLPNYYAVNTATSGVNVLSFATSFGPSNSHSPNSATPLSLRFYAPNDSMAGADGFVTLSITNVTGSDWAVLGVRGGPGTWNLQTVGAAPPNGLFTLYDLPVTAGGQTGWYQIVFGGTTYNIYATSSGGAFLPIEGPSSNPLNFVVDHGLGYGPGQGVSQNATGLFGYSVNFAPSGTITYDISVFSPPGTQVGTNGIDTFAGTAGNDFFNGAPGNDTINGGLGHDTAVSWLPSKNFTLAAYADSASVVSQARFGTDGTDALNSIEKLQFRDQTIDASTVVKTAHLTGDQIEQLVDMYAEIGRAPDALGLSYWGSQLHDGHSVAEIYKSFFLQPEVASIFPASMTNQEFVTKVYGNLLSRTPDAAGLAYWVGQLAQGQVTKATFLLPFLSGIHGNTADQTTLDNKEVVGTHFAIDQGLTNAGWARTVMAHVDGTAASVATANAQTDGFTAIASAEATTELMVKIVGVSFDHGQG